MQTRRDFIKNSSLLLAASMLPTVLACSSSQRMPFGLILYTVRDEMEKDPVATLRKISAMGYQVLEAASYNDGNIYGMRPAEIRDLVESLNMRLLSIHVDVNNADIESLGDNAAEAGLKFIIQPSMAYNSLDDFKRGTDNYNKYGEQLAKKGLSFGFHNHNKEFRKLEDVIPYDYLLENTDPSLVCMELDLYWIIKGGADPISYFKKYPGRFSLWHLKDMDSKAGGNVTELGTGTIDFNEICTYSKQAGLKQYFVEQDDSFKISSMDSIQTSLDYLKSLEI